MFGFSNSKNKNPAPESGVLNLAVGQVPFTIIRSRKRRRSIAFAIDPGDRLRIMVPVRTNISHVNSLLKRRADWISRKITEFRAASLPGPSDFRDGEIIGYLGHSYRLSLTQDEKAPQGCNLHPHRFEVNITDKSLSKENLREEVRLEILFWLKRRAKAKFQKRLDLWADRLGVRYRKLVIASPQRQWGSCNAQNVIRLNWRLIMAPLPLIDYVAAHELCHVLHKNHSAHFWRQLASVMPDWQVRRRKLRKARWATL